jgi:hypothetical protein
MSKPAPLYIRIFILLTILAAMLGACASASSPSESREFDSSAGAPAPAEAPAAPAGESAFDSGGGKSLAQTAERLVIKNAALTIVVDDPSQTVDAISRMAEELGGYVVSADLSYTETDSGAEIPRGSITMRVPAEQLNEALKRIEAESGRDPLDKNITSQDVTSEYTDLQSRLRNLEAAEAQLTEIMGSATRTEDVLNVYSQLTQVRGEIEVIKGQMQYYEQSAALSSISTEILANAAVQPLSIGGWEPAGVARNAVQALIGGVKFVANAAIWLVLFFLPMAILIFLPLALVWMLVRRVWGGRRRRTKTPLPPAQPAG